METIERKGVVLPDDFLWEAIGNIGKQNGWPDKLVVMLRDLVLVGQNNAPSATLPLVALAKEYLADGIWIKDKHFEVAVYVSRKTGIYSFFALVPKMSGHKLMRLEEL